MFLTILPFGYVDKEIVDHVQKNLTDAFPNCLCRRSRDILQIPQDAYNPARRQYNSTVILSSISRYAMKQKADKVLGITDSDLHVPSLNFVFGEAQLLGKAAVISLYRLKTEFYGNPSNKQLFKERAAKEAIHEIGHTLGLKHCHNSACVMHFSNSILDTDLKNTFFCRSCKSTLTTDP